MTVYTGTAGNLTAVSGCNRVELSWTPAENAVGYYIYATYYGSSYHYVGMTSSLKYSDRNASLNGYNYYWVYPYVVKSSGEKLFGTCPKYVYAKPTAYSDEVTNLRAVSQTGGVKLTWTAAASADGYLIYGKRGSSASYGYIGMTTGTSFTDTKAISDDWNFYWVFPYVYDRAGKMQAGKCSKYVYGKAK